MDPNAQVNGIVAIEDMTGFSIKHTMSLYTPENSKKFTAIYQVVAYNDIPILIIIFLVFHVPIIHRCHQNLNICCLANLPMFLS